ncbi:hypothetical protein TNCV_1771051 [Trichonephila clavipes]|nr:hypothetical protein TNCV_1771051 [Trichonephila clavipes]
MERSYLFFSGSLVARTYDVSNEEKFRFHRSHLFAGNIVEIVRIDTSPQVFVSGSNLYTGGIFVDGSLKNTPLHRLFCYLFRPLHRRNEVEKNSTSTQVERSFRKMAARLLHGRLLCTFQTLIKIEIFFQSRPLHRRSIHAEFKPLHRLNIYAEFKPLHRLNEVFEKWRSVSFTDAVVHCPDFGSKSKFYRSRPSPHNLWETTRGPRFGLSYGLFNIKQKLIKKVVFNR